MHFVLTDRPAIGVPANFELVSDFEPAGDQPQAISEIIDGINAQYHNPLINFKETIYARLATWSSLHITQARCHG